MKIFGHSIKTSVLGYIIGALVAIQPILMEPINWDSRHDLAKYAFRILVAVLIAVFGRMAADSTQVKQVQAQANMNTALIDTHLIQQDQVNRDQQDFNKALPPNENPVRDEI